MVAPRPFANLPVPTCADVARFMNRVTITDDCWLINGCPTGNGYVQFQYQGCRVLAHRFAFLVAAGWLPDDMLDHGCRVTNCVKPWHLEPVDNRENQARGYSPISTNIHKTHCIRGHEFAPENTRIVRTTGERVCLTCRRADDLRRFHARDEEWREQRRQRRRAARRVESFS